MTVSDRIDYFFNKMLPKKLIVWIVATFLVADSKISGDIWGYITLLYLGVNVLQKFAQKPPFLYDRKEGENNEEN